MSISCYICEKEIDKEEEASIDYTECDSCVRNFHYKCAGTKAKERDARNASKCLRLFCRICMEDCEGTLERLKEMTKLLYKLDLHNQMQIVAKQAENETIATISSQLKSLEAKVSKLETGTTTQTSSSTHTHTYASTVKRGNVQPAVVIKPKKKQQNSKKTFSEISENVNNANVDVCGSRNVRGGGIVLRCNNAADTMKVKQLVNDKFGDSYEVLLPKIKSPRLRISNIDPELENDDILGELKNHNQPINNMDMKLVAVIPRKYRDNEYNDIVVEVSSAAYKQLMEMGKLRLPWRECRIFEHLYLIRCYKCCGFFHKSTDCKNSQKCSTCSGPHKSVDCKSKSKCCANCKESNTKFKTKLSTNHHAWSKDCSILKRHQAKLASKIEFNENE